MPARNRSFSLIRAVQVLGIAAMASMAALTACSPVTVLNRLAEGKNYVRTADLAYGPNARMKLDIYQPEGRPERAPVVVFFYGGSWQNGSRDEYLFVGEALASRGIVTVIADYRLYPEVKYLDMLRDSGAAVAWTFAHIAQYGGDPARIVVAGHSAGAYNAAMVAYDPRWLAPYGLAPNRLAGFVGMAGPYNFLPIETESVKPIFDFPDTPADSQPIAHVGPHAIPTLLLAANNDRFVFPDRNTEKLAEALRKAGDAVTVKRYDGVSHATLVGSMARPLRGLAPVRDDFSSFVLALPAVPATQ